MLIKRADLFLIKNIGDKLKDKVFNIQTQYKLLKLIKIGILYNSVYQPKSL